MTARPRRPRRALGPLAATLATLSAACGEALPTAVSERLVKNSVSVQVTLPFAEFGTRARVFGGYGRASELGSGFIAHEFGAPDAPGAEGDGGLEAATLLRFGSYPRVASLPDTAGTTRPDSSLTFLSGRIVARFDTVGSVAPGPVRIRAHEVREPWDDASATWDFAVDTPGARVPWSRPGGGFADEIGSAVWDPTSGDTVALLVDSAHVASWADTTRTAPGIRLSTDAAGARLQLRSALLWIETLPSIDPDTLIEVRPPTETTTFVYAPTPPAPDGWLRVGGAPAWRTVLDLNLPRTLSDHAELCRALPCPVALAEERVSYAALRLAARAPRPAFAPSDTLSMDLRMVTLPDILPKSPLGPSTIGFAGISLPPEWFAAPGGRVVEVPVTGLVRDLLRGETADGEAVTQTVALLSTIEPLSIEYATFEGTASERAPELRLILNFAGGGEG